MNSVMSRLAAARRCRGSSDSTWQRRPRVRYPTVRFSLCKVTEFIGKSPHGVLFRLGAPLSALRRSYQARGDRPSISAKNAGAFELKPERLALREPLAA